MKKITSLTNTCIRDIYKAFAFAFDDYQVQITEQEFYSMIKRRGFSADVSFGCFVDNELVAFTLNGVGQYNGIKTIYDTGTGTIPEYRGKGIAGDILRYSLPFLKQYGAKQYLLEVLQHNTSAVSIYQKLGFKVVRELDYFQVDNKNIAPIVLLDDDHFSFMKIDLSYKKQMQSFWDFTPSWQNSFESIERQYDTFQFFGVFYHEHLVGYSIFDPITGDVAQIAVSKKMRKRGIARYMLSVLANNNQHKQIKIVNTQAGNRTFRSFAEKVKIPVSGQQFEMILEID